MLKRYSIRFVIKCHLSWITIWQDSYTWFICYCAFRLRSSIFLRITYINILNIYYYFYMHSFVILIYHKCFFDFFTWCMIRFTFLTKSSWGYFRFYSKIYFEQCSILLTRQFQFQWTLSTKKIKLDWFFKIYCQHLQLLFQMKTLLFVYKSIEQITYLVLNKKK